MARGAGTRPGAVVAVERPRRPTRRAVDRGKPPLPEFYELAQGFLHGRDSLRAQPAARQCVEPAQARSRHRLELTAARREEDERGARVLRVGTALDEPVSLEHGFGA